MWHLEEIFETLTGKNYIPQQHAFLKGWSLFAFPHQFFLVRSSRIVKMNALKLLREKNIKTVFNVVFPGGVGTSEKKMRKPFHGKDGRLGEPFITANFFFRLQFIVTPREKLFPWVVADIVGGDHLVLASLLETLGTYPVCQCYIFQSLHARSINWCLTFCCVKGHPRLSF